MYSRRMGGLIALVVLIGSILILTIGGGVTATTDESHFNVTIDEADESIEEGDTLVVHATITNTGNAEDSQQIHLKNFDNGIVDTIAGPPVTLEPGESETVTLRWETDRGDAGAGEFKVASNDEFPVRSLEIREGEFFDVSIAEHDSPITAGEELSVDVEVTNAGTSTATPTVWFALGESMKAERTVDLDPGETERVMLTWKTNRTHVGEWTLTVGADDEREEVSPIVIEDDTEQTSYSSGGGSDIIVDRSNSLIEGSVANVSGHDIERVEFAEDVDGRISVDELRRLPDDTEGIDDLVAVYRIHVPEEAFDTAATIHLTVDAGALDGADAEEVLVAHWNGEEWIALPTEATVHDGDVTISAEAQGFSLFAVTTGNEPEDGPADETETPTETPDETPSTETSTDSSMSTEESSNTDASASTPETAATNTDEDVPGFGVGAALLALIATGTLAAYRRRLS